MIGGLQGEEWKFIQKYPKENISCGVGRNRGKFAPRKGVCEFGRCCAKFSHKPGAVVLRRPYLPHFSSKSYTVWSVGFLTSWALKWYIEGRKWTSGSAPKVRKTIVAAVLYFLHSVFLFSIVLSLHTLNDFGKGLWSSKAWFFINLSFQKLCHNLSK